MEQTHLKVTALLSKSRLLGLIIGYRNPLFLLALGYSAAETKLQEPEEEQAGKIVP